MELQTLLVPVASNGVNIASGSMYAALLYIICTIEEQIKLYLAASMLVNIIF